MANSANKKRDETALVREMRRVVISILASAKAYDVPVLCVRFKLETGSEAEAFSSKHKYVQKRLAIVDAPRLISIARELLGESDNYALSEIVAKYDELGGAEISELTRKRLVDIFEGAPLCTEIQDLQFLKRIWPLAEMTPVNDPSHYGRSMEEALVQHTIRNDDWSNRDLFEALGFSNCSRNKIFHFLAEVTSPLAQSSARQFTLAAAINEKLKHDGYTLATDGKISGSPQYSVKILNAGSPSDESISAVLAAFDPNEIHARWKAALDRREGEPQGAITLARTLLEDVCKWILDEAREAYKDDDDLPALYRKLAKILKLAPDDHTEQIFKQILGSCQSVVESLGALRNKLGDAHGIGRKRARPLARHAELAVNLSGAMATFLVSTWQARQAETSEK